MAGIPPAARPVASGQGPAAQKVHRSLDPHNVHEGALFVLFEAMILKLRATVDVDPDVVRANHTNLE